MKCFNVSLLIFSFLICSSAVIGKDDLSYVVVGSVADEQGIPLAGVEIRNYSDEIMATTDKNGKFSMIINKNIDCCVAIFSLAGYKQITKIFQYGTKEITVVMQLGDSFWSPPLCDSSSKKSNLLGWDLKVIIPKKAEVKKFADFDNIRIHLGFKSESEYQWMELGTGIIWLAVIPYKSLLLSHDVKERVIKGDGKGYYYEYTNDKGNIRDVREHIGIDYGGIDEHGKKWREV